MIAARRKRRIYTKNKPYSPGIGFLAFLCGLGIVILWVFVAYVNPELKLLFWNGLKTQTEKFQVSGVTMGMSLRKVTNLRPGTVVKQDRNGETVGLFQWEDAAHAVWFLDQGHGRQAYRIRYDKTFHTLSEREVLSHIAEKYGRPATSDCARLGAKPGTRCHFQWLAREGIFLDVYTRMTKQASGGERTDLTIIAVDTYLEGKARRQGTPGRSMPTTKAGQAIPITSIVRKAESLPF